VKRFRYQVTWTVDDPADGLGLLPIAPPRMSRVLGAVLRRLVDDDAESQAEVGAVTVACQQEATWPRLPLAMIPLPSGGAGHGGGPDA
jgi:hypothetical protein